MRGAVNITLEEAVKRMENAERIVTEIRDELFDKGYEITGWHLNGDTEPIDTWFEDNDWEI